MNWSSARAMKIYKVLELELWNELMCLYKEKYRSQTTREEPKGSHTLSQIGGKGEFKSVVNPDDYWTSFESTVEKIKGQRENIAKKRTRRF